MSEKRVAQCGRWPPPTGANVLILARTGDGRKVEHAGIDALLEETNNHLSAGEIHYEKPADCGRLNVSSGNINENPVRDGCIAEIGRARKGPNPPGQEVGR